MMRRPAWGAAAVALAVSMIVAVAPSPVSAHLADAPGKVPKPTVTAAHKKLKVEWQAPTTGAAVTGYRVQYKGCADGTCTRMTTDWLGADARSYIFEVASNRTYVATVWARNSAHEGDWSFYSDEVTPQPVPDQPSAPTLTAGNRQIGVSWNAPSNNGFAISDYDVQYRACTATPATCTASPTWGGWTDRSGETSADTSTSVTLTGLTNDTAYQVRVRAANEKGEGWWSDAGSATVSVQEPDAPAAPALTLGDAQVGVAWTAPNSNGSPITDYDVQYRACTAAAKNCATSPSWGSWTAWNASSESTALSATITGLTNGTAYQVQVNATNDVGTGAWSPSATIVAGLPAAPSAPTVTATTARRDSLDVSWSAPAANGSTITDYDVQYRACTANCASTTPTWASSWTSLSHAGTATTAQITGLTKSTKHQVQVRATNSAGTGAWSPSGTAATNAAGTPGAPRNLTVSKVANSGTLLDLSWQAPSDTGGVPISDYDVKYQLDGVGNPWKTFAHDGAATSTQLTGLTPGKRYWVQVRAANGTGSSRLDSAWSAEVPQRTHAPPDQASSPDLSASLIHSGSCPQTGNCTQVSVQWHKCGLGASGFAITDYDVQYSLDTYSWTDVPHVGTGRSLTITGLGHGKHVYVRVRAGNVVGEGKWSDWNNERTPDRPKPDPEPDPDPQPDPEPDPEPADPVQEPVGNSGNQTQAPVSSQATAGGAEADVAEPVRYEGPDRYMTSAETAQGYADAANGSTSTPKMNTVIVASGANFPDALAAASLARKLSAPILLTQPDKLSDSVKQFLADNPAVNTAYLLGGTAAVSEAVEQELRTLAPLGQRVAGPTRYETAVEIATAQGSLGLWCNTLESAVILAPGDSWLDAAIAGPAAYRGRHPILLTRSDALPDATAQYLASAAPKRAIVVGDTGSISGDVVDAVEALGISVTRIADADAAARAAAFARATQVPPTVSGATDGCMGRETVGLATMHVYADALSAGPLLGRHGAPLLFTSAGDGLPEATLAYVRSAWFEPTDSTPPVIAIGGTAVVPQAHIDRIIRIAG